MFDVVIIGGGPAGLSAAIYAVRKSLKVLLVTKNIGGQAAQSGDIENYLGFSLISGADLVLKFKEEIERFKDEGLWIKEGIEVKSVNGEEGRFLVNTTGGGFWAKTIIVSSGRNPKMLNIPGEKEFLGKGVSTCATCDGPLYKGKDVVIIGGGNSSLAAAYSLMKIVNSVSIVNITNNISGDEVLIKNVTSASNVKILNNSTAIEIKGKDKVEKVLIQNMQTHVSSSLKADGVFIEIGWTPSSDFIPQVAKNKLNEIVVDEFGQTSVPGIWAAGDVNNLWGEQIVIAAGEGAKVALSVAEHIAKIPHQATSNIHEGV